MAKRKSADGAEGTTEDLAQAPATENEQPAPAAGETTPDGADTIAADGADTVPAASDDELGGNGSAPPLERAEGFLHGDVVVAINAPTGTTDAAILAALEAAAANLRAHVLWGDGGARPDEATLMRLAQDAPWTLLDVRYVGPGERGKVAGLNLQRDEAQQIPVARVADFGPSYLRALAVDERIDVRIART